MPRHARRSARATFVPQFETLEDRCVPACSGTGGFLTAYENTPYTLQRSDFGFTADSNSPANFLSVTFSYPSGFGSLTDQGSPIGNAQSVSVADIDAGYVKYTPQTNYTGYYVYFFGFNVQDDGGTANGRVDTDPYTKYTTINVDWVNQTPSFTASDPPAVGDDSDPVSISSWATFNAGPSNESSQTATYTVTDVSNPSLFEISPEVSASGTLTYKVAPSIVGTSTFTLKVQDNGGTANGAVDTSAESTFTITVQPMVKFDSSEYWGDQGNTGTITVCLSAASSQDVTVAYATSDGTAEAGSDYTAASGTITILAGHTSATFTVSALTDGDAVDGQAFIITLSSPTNAFLGTPSQAEFTIFVALAVDEDPIPRLNSLSGDINAGLAAIDDLVNQTTPAGIDLLLTQMATARAAGSWTVYTGCVQSLEHRVQDVLDAARDIIRDATDAAERSQGEKFRIEGIGSDLVHLNIRLGAISDAIGAERTALPAGSNFRDTLNALTGNLSAAALSATYVYPAHIGDEPPTGDTTIEDLNDTYDDMDGLLTVVGVYDDDIEGYDEDMWIAAANMATGVPGAGNTYWDLVADVATAVDQNCAVTANDGANDISAYNYALSAKTATAGDAFALKGIRAFVSYFDSYLQSELAIVHAQYNAMLILSQSVTVDPTIFQNLEDIGDELDAARSIIADI